jgi:hypothetical protein
LYLTTQVHQEERFVMPFWPYLLVAACGVAGGWLARQTESRIRRRMWVASGIVVLLLTLDGLRGVRLLSWNDHGTRLRDAQAFVARQSDVTGLLLDEYFDGGGYAAFGRDVPMARYGADRLPSPLFNYVIAGHDGVVKEAERAGFTAIRRVRDVVVLRRR